MLLKEAVNLNSIKILNERDAQFLKKIGLYLFDSLDERIDDVIKEASCYSYLYSVLNNQSLTSLQETKSIMLDNIILSEGCKDSYIVKGYLETSPIINEDEYSPRSFIENNVVLNFSVVNEWIKSYLPRSKDSNNIKSIIRSCYYPVKKESDRKCVLLRGMGI